MKVTLEWVGPLERAANGKDVRKVRFNGQEYSAWERTAKALDGCGQGTVIDATLSENGKYLNKFTREGAAGNASGGTASPSKTFGSDPEKDIAVYTRYTMDYILEKGCAIDQAITDVFAIREKVKERLTKKVAAQDAVQDIKVKTALGLMKQIDPDAPMDAWTPYIEKQAATKASFEKLMIALNACLDGSKRAELTPDGIPAFVDVA